MKDHPHWGPTDALLHGGFSQQPDVQTLEIKLDASGAIRAIQDEAARIGIVTDSFTFPEREPVYDGKDTMRQTPLRPLSGEEVHQIASIKEVGQELIDLLNTLPESRELAVAKTNIEQGVMWAIKGVTK